MFAMSDGKASAAHPDAVVQGPTYRFTVLTSRLLRLEWSERGEFVDQPTQAVVSRDFEPVPFMVTETPDSLDIRTDDLHLHYNKQAFSSAGLSVNLHRGAPDFHHSTWRFEDELPQSLPWRGNLEGTARTVDEADGAVPLEAGILATYGFAVMDDSTSIVLSDDGWIQPRPVAGSLASKDLYFFGHGRDYAGALRDFARLSGPVPLVPRGTLGNWWSRYWRYDEREYVDLMDRFRREGVPLSVAVIDMDWHVVDVDPEIGTGWTGYTWNHDLFPDPERFLTSLHERGLAVTLNVHPADGVRRHEAAYPDMARALGIDPESGVGIPFDITSREFVDAYLTYLHHPLEEQGVDFWWLDWQSGGTTKIAGLDPLWMLNHIHFTDSGRDGKRPLTFSRYGGHGSHRTPVGFSGDSIISWDSLAFQPRFTATAANVAYTWWSHDIGGHMFGSKDVELAVRWFQLGTFSPINRLHSSSSPFTSKEPWQFGQQAQDIMTTFLRLRHLLVPYLYTAAWRAHTDVVGVVRPMYHDYPEVREAYTHPNQAMFGADLLIAPVVSAAEKSSHLATVSVWLPEGAWYDIFSGHRYQGGRVVTMHRDLETFPVLARAGTVLPLQADPFAAVGTNPQELVLRVFPGSGRAELIEDDGSGAPGLGERQVTAVVVVQGEAVDGRYDLTLRIAPPSGPGVLTNRTLSIDLVGVAGAEHIGLRVGEQEGAFEVVNEPRDEVSTTLAPAMRIELGAVELGEGLELRLTGVRSREMDLVASAFTLLDRAEIAYHAKESAWQAVKESGGLALVQQLNAIDLPGVLRDALVELAAVSEDS